MKIQPKDKCETIIVWCANDSIIVLTRETLVSTANKR